MCIVMGSEQATLLKDSYVLLQVKTYLLVQVSRSKYIHIEFDYIGQGC